MTSRRRPIAARSVASPPKATDSAAIMRSMNSDSSTIVVMVFMSKIGRFGSRRCATWRTEVPMLDASPRART
jgi:hypothetical protein